MKAILTFGVLMLASQIAFSFPSSVDELPYYVQDKHHCKTSIWLVNEKPSNQQLENRITDYGLSVNDLWFSDDEKSWASGCLATRSKDNEERIFIEAIKQYRGAIKFYLDKKKLTRQIESDTRYLGYAKTNLKRVENRSSKVKSIFSKMHSCSTFKKYGAEPLSNLTRVEENRDLFYVGLCTALKDHEFRAVSSEKLKLVVSGLSMNGGAEIQFYLKPNSKGVWTPFEYKNYYGGRGYKVSSLWKSAVAEVVLTGSQQFGQDLYAFKQNRGAVNRYRSEINDYQRAIEKNQKALDLLISNSSF